MLNQIPGVGDRWLFLRIQAMMKSGELIEVSAAISDHPYSGVVNNAVKLNVIDNPRFISDVMGKSFGNIFTKDSTCNNPYDTQWFDIMSYKRKNKMAEFWDLRYR